MISPRVSFVNLAYEVHMEIIRMVSNSAIKIEPACNLDNRPQRCDVEELREVLEGLYTQRVVGFHAINF